MAYLREIVAPKCNCGKPAKVEVFGRYNERYGPKCRACGTHLVAALRAEQWRNLIPPIPAEEREK